MRAEGGPEKKEPEMLASEAGARNRECMLPGRRVLATGKWEGCKDVREPRGHLVLPMY